MPLTQESIRWAIDFVARHGEGDIFPKVLEIKAIQDFCDKFVELLANSQLASIDPGAHRRFIVPKDETSYRHATQLDPQDSIILSAIIYEYGQRIEDRRLPATQVFSYRFHPSDQEGLYATHGAWNEFWTVARAKGRESTIVLCCDIADFYNQIYHHTVENQLIASGFPNQAIKWIIRMLESTTAGVSRGIPIGPHGIHLIAEGSLIPIDNSLLSYGIDFLRYADDIVVFCNDTGEAKDALATIVQVLDKQQRLTLQQSKTSFMEPNAFVLKCDAMIADRSISGMAKNVLKMIRKYSGGDPYRTVSYQEIALEDWDALTEEDLRAIVLDYTDRDPVDYMSLSWFYRRLSQIGHPGAIDVSLDEAAQLGPILATICSYLASVTTIEPERWDQIGRKLLELLDSDDVKRHEFFRLSILSLFSKNAYIDHFSDLAVRFQHSDSSVRREILLAAKIHRAIDWVREQKEAFQAMDPWQRNAFLFCISDFPRDEKRYFIRRYSFNRPFENTLAKWAKAQ